MGRSKKQTTISASEYRLVPFDVGILCWTRENGRLCIDYLDYPLLLLALARSEYRPPAELEARLASRIAEAVCATWMMGWILSAGIRGNARSTQPRSYDSYSARNFWRRRVRNVWLAQPGMQRVLVLAPLDVTRSMIFYCSPLLIGRNQN